MQVKGQERLRAARSRRSARAGRCRFGAPAPPCAGHSSSRSPEEMRAQASSQANSGHSQPLALLSGTAPRPLTFLLTAST